MKTNGYSIVLLNSPVIPNFYEPTVFRPRGLGRSYGVGNSASSSGYSGRNEAYINYFFGTLTKSGPLTCNP